MRQNKKGLGTSLLLLLFLSIIGGVVYLANSPIFERVPPKISVPSSLFWNLKQPLKVHLSDSSGIRSYKVILNDGKSDFTVLDEKVQNPQQELDIAVQLPKAGWDRRTKSATMTIIATDGSQWNFMKGNESTKSVKITIDSKRPQAFVLSNSYKIVRGGSAIVVFGAKDEYLDKIEVHTNFGKVFKPEPFYKDGYYVALIAWPVTQKRFRAWVEVTDLAGNRSKAHIPLYVENYRYRHSKIKLKKRFLEGKIADLSTEFDETASISDPLKQFKLINETVREKNEDLIHSLSSNVSDALIKHWNIKPFYPLKNAKKVASFGDHRFYYYNGKLVSESYHLGLDLASVKMAKIKSSNPGRVVFSGYNGIYGNMPLIDHGLGLYTIYGHCSTLLVKDGDDVSRNSVIAKTGKTGLALGDHLHFGVIVQGVEVRPIEWMDGHWIHDNISQVMKVARKMIDRRE
ncbi:M23 family metallopeptidase [Hydrogenimonas thermophila]|uniref:Murein DD-endopeptidase MepM and murein hydrolase activator NlpD, contain LysM domain n=1 Tax=Hydrogenimonas thermophila TaxID=223786 RepID=A0A1I5SWA6_9BACT|nr:M23 family metallopeptidase [Hydrogenimonas thermophila]WOE70418.1 M23 family metallopeptidase [Hydrogenimonas thermophila]WOE72933.1 M23 family metallopeptidase [Hydrogenimonas thermophila]SFP75030.1 Murein DD-endopeptidase MepM and murein hydrolase activator NlpD, contain LysM domain [Hydrogenimonas thermophila]